jgi:mercuric reductase
VIAQKDALVAEMRQTKYVDVLDAYPQITLLRGRARFLDERRVAVDGRELRPGQVVIATGARPWAPPIPGLEAAGYLTSTTALALPALPDSLIVLGANAVGLELAQLFARAGVDVTLLELQPRIAPFEDEAISAALHDYLEAEGIHILADFTTERVEKDGERYRLHGDWAGEKAMLEAAQLLVATGRRSNSEGLDLAAAGVRVGPRGEIVVDETLRTNNPHIYAAGDVLGGDMYVYVAAYGGGLAAENALTGAGRIYDTHAIPRVNFTDPQIASTGLTEQQARPATTSRSASWKWARCRGRWRPTTRAGSSRSLSTVRTGNFWARTSSPRMRGR